MKEGMTFHLQMIRNFCIHIYNIALRNETILPSNLNEFFYTYYWFLCVFLTLKFSYNQYHALANKNKIKSVCVE